MPPIEENTAEVVPPTTPAETAPVEIEVEEEDSGFDFAGIDNAIEQSVVEDPEATPPAVGEPVAGAAAATPEVVPPVDPASPPAGQTPPAAAEATPAAVATAAPAVDPNATPAAPAPASQQAQPPAEDGFSTLDRAIEAGREDLIKAVAHKVYQLPAEELEAVQTEPEVAIPRLLARVHVNTVQGVIRHIAQQMPAMVGALMQAQVENGKREEQFFSQWPQLDKTKHRDQILQVGQVFRQVNPNATLEDFIKHVGAQVVLMNGLHTQQQPTAPVAPPQPVSPAFVPAGAGRQSNPAPAPSNNPWAELVEVMNE